MCPRLAFLWKFLFSVLVPSWFFQQYDLSTDLVNTAGCKNDDVLISGSWHWQVKVFCRFYHSSLISGVSRSTQTFHWNLLVLMQGPDCLCIWCSTNILTGFLLFYLSEQKDSCLLFLGQDDISYPFSEAPVTALHDADAELASGPVHNCELHIQAGRLDSHLYLWGVQATISTNNVYLPLKYLGLAWYGYLGYFDLVNYGSHMMNLVDVEFSCQYSKRIYCYGAPQC